MTKKVKAGDRLKLSHEDQGSGNVKFICEYADGTKTETIASKNATVEIDGKKVSATFNPKSNTWVAN